MANCSKCNAPIVWIKTIAGKNMPCDASVRRYKILPDGKDKVITPEGKVVSCEIDCDQEELTGMGYIPHWATCPKANEFRKRGSR